MATSTTSDITQNLFWFFRAAQQSDGQRIWQIENNMTKALIVLLKNTKSQTLLRAFLKQLGIQYREGESVNFTLQRKPAIPSRVARRIVLKITSEESESWDSKDRDRRGRPDATIWTKRWAVLIESKIGSGIDESQIKGHLKSFGWPNNTIRKEVTWAEIHKVLKKAGAAYSIKNNQRDQFILQHWCEYMEDQGMSDFNGWVADDFRFFDLPEGEQRSVRWHLQERLKAFRDKLATTPLCRKVASLYGGKNQEWKSDLPSFWFNIGSHQSKKDWHITVYLQRQGLRIHTILNDGGSNWRLHEDTKYLDDVLSAAWSESRNAPICAQIECVRWPKKAYGWRQAVWDSAGSLDLSVIPKTAKKAVAAWVRQLLDEVWPKKGGRAELRFECIIPAEELVKLDCDAQVRRTLKTIKALLPILNTLRKR